MLVSSVVRTIFNKHILHENFVQRTENTSSLLIRGAIRVSFSGGGQVEDGIVDSRLRSSEAPLRGPYKSLNKGRTTECDVNNHVDSRDVSICWFKISELKKVSLHRFVRFGVISFSVFTKRNRLQFKVLTFRSPTIYNLLMSRQKIFRNVTSDKGLNYRYEVHILIETGGSSLVKKKFSIFSTLFVTTTSLCVFVTDVSFYDDEIEVFVI